MQSLFGHVAIFEGISEASKGSDGELGVMR